MTHLLKSTQVSKTYQMNGGRQETVLNAISMHVERGEFVSLMGSSGSGKSTLLHCLSGMDSVSSGSVWFDGVELSSLSEDQLTPFRLNNMGFVFQQPYLLKNLSILDNIVLSAYLASRIPRAEIQNRALGLMRKMQIAELADHDIAQASGGQLQRVSICRALMNDPDILFGDEPTGALNSQSTHAILEIFLELNRSGTTIFLVTHDVKVASRSERVLYMQDGMIIAECRLGKYDAGQHREQHLTDWLHSMGF